MLTKSFDTYYEIARIEFTTLYGVDVTCRIKGLRLRPLKTFTATGNPLTISMLGGGDTLTAIKGT